MTEPFIPERKNWADVYGSQDAIPPDETPEQQPAPEPEQQPAPEPEPEPEPEPKQKASKKLSSSE